MVQVILARWRKAPGRKKIPLQSNLGLGPPLAVVDVLAAVGEELLHAHAPVAVLVHHVEQVLCVLERIAQPKGDNRLVELSAARPLFPPPWGRVGMNRGPASNQEGSSLASSLFSSQLLTCRSPPPQFPLENPGGAQPKASVCTRRWKSRNASFRLFFAHTKAGTDPPQGVRGGGCLVAQALQGIQIPSPLG